MARAPRVREACRVVKKRWRRKGGEEVGEDVSALQSHWRTDILERCIRRTYMWPLCGGSPYGSIERPRSEPEPLTDIM